VSVPDLLTVEKAVVLHIGRSEAYELAGRYLASHGAKASSIGGLESGQRAPDQCVERGRDGESFGGEDLKFVVASAQILCEGVSRDDHDGPTLPHHRVDQIVPATGRTAGRSRFPSPSGNALPKSTCLAEWRLIPRRQAEQVHRVVRSISTACVISVLVSACGSGSQRVSSTTRSSIVNSSTTAGSTTSSAATTTLPTGSSSTLPTGSSSETTSPETVRSGCTAGPGRPPAGAKTRSVEDVDGDGRRDTAWMTAPAPATGVTTFGISTAAGGGASIPYQSASPVRRSALVVNADKREPVEIVLSDGRVASLYAFSGCAIKEVLNPQGQDYKFDLGFGGHGTGVGCVSTKAGRRLVGLNAKLNGARTTVGWTRTIIELRGLTALRISRGSGCDGGE
jgi:hypothetical protein